eukprot:Selendium_serpulae@DN890_c0_g1_i1.p1
MTRNLMNKKRKNILQKRLRNAESNKQQIQQARHYFKRQEKSDLLTAQQLAIKFNKVDQFLDNLTSSILDTDTRLQIIQDSVPTLEKKMECVQRFREIVSQDNFPDPNLVCAVCDSPTSNSEMSNSVVTLKDLPNRQLLFSDIESTPQEPRHCHNVVKTIEGPYCLSRRGVSVIRQRHIN